MEKHLQEIFDAMTEGCQIIDYSFRYVYVNDAVAKQNRRTKKELLGQTMMDIHPGIENTDMFMHLRDCMEKRVFRSLENEFEYSDGTRGWFELRMEPIAYGVLILSQDITERKKAEEMVSMQAVALEAAANGVVITDVKGFIQWVNPAFSRLTGYTFEEAVGQSTRILNSGKHNASFYQNLWSIILSGKIWHGEMIDRKKDGSLYTEEQTITPVKDKNGKIIRFIAIKQDVTLRKKLEEELVLRNADLERRDKIQEKTQKAMMNIMRDLEDARTHIEQEKVRDEAMLAGIGEGLIAIDKNRKIMILNKAAENMLGWKMKDIVGYEIATLPLQDSEGHLIPLDKRPAHIVLSTGIMINSGYFFVRKDGTKFPIAMNVTPITLKGEIIGAVEIFRDITHEKEIDRAKSEFVSLASHQLRTPLSAIKWYSQMLLHEDAGKITKKQKEYLEEIHTGNERMVSLVNALLNVSRIEMGTFAVQPKKLNIVTLCKEVLEEHKKQIADKQITLKEVFTRVPDIEADPNYIRIIFQNLIENATKYTPEKGKITITIDKKDTDIVIQVADTGYGIPEKAKEKIFTKLFRADNAVTKETDGTGLGLYITKSIIEQAAHGTIRFESEENKGTTFFVSLPVDGMSKREGVKALL